MLNLSDLAAHCPWSKVYKPVFEEQINQLVLDDCIIYFDGLKQLRPQLQKYSRLFVLVDENTEQHCLPMLDELLVDTDYCRIKIRSGELQKNIDTCQHIWKALFQGGADRKSLIINLGGGVIGDMGGFAASCYMRGLDFVQIPTTLLSQVDASVGGKLGIDFYGLKNSIGLFKNPKAVFVDVRFLDTLPTEELRSGFAEVIKHALIADRPLWEALVDEADFTYLSWKHVVPHSVRIKHDIVLRDPLEQADRKLLNFGHTIGHAIESVLLPTPKAILHGEAVAAGMLCEVFLSVALKLVNESVLTKLSEYILPLYGKVDLDNIDNSKLLERMKHDKKNVGDKINFTLLQNIGNGVINQTADASMIEASLNYYRQLTVSS